MLLNKNWKMRLRSKRKINKKKICSCIGLVFILSISSVSTYAYQQNIYVEFAKKIDSPGGYNGSGIVVTYRSGDNMLLINGTPFFPIGDYAGARYPFNSHNYNSTTTQFWLQQPYVEDRMIFFGGNILFSTLHNNFWENGYQQVLWGVNHPNFLGWHSLDEPRWKYDRGLTDVTVDDLLWIYDRIKGNETVEGDDPNHPIWMNFACADFSDDLDTWIEKRYLYSQAADIVSVDVYNKGLGGCPQCDAESPWCVLENPYLSVVGDFVDVLINNVTKGEKPVFIVPQAWGAVNESEIRFQCWQAIIHGVNGIYFWWSAGGNGQWQLVLPDALNVAEELVNLHDVLVARKIDKTVTATSGIESMVKRVNGDYYILAVNRNPQGVLAEFDLASLNLNMMLYYDSVELINEDIDIDIINDSFNIYFKPFDTHIIKIDGTMTYLDYISHAIEI